MSEIKSGSATSEFKNTLPAELFGYILCITGVAGVPLYGWQAIAVCAIGSAILCVALTSYVGSRGAIKAAAAAPKPYLPSPGRI